MRNFDTMPTPSLRYLIFFILLTLSIGSSAQRNTLRLQKGLNGFYLEHKVSAKQSFFSLSRMYNVHPRHLAGYNKLDYNKGLQINQLIRIPLSDTNFQQKKGEGVPVYLTASTDDVLSDMARFAGIDVGDMQCWNSFTGNNVKKGSSWIVGFLNTQELNEQQMKIACTNKPVVSPTAPTVQPPTTTQLASAVPSASFFQSAFLEQIQKTPISQQLTLMASVFKTSSGWQDAKFYVLIDNLVPGTVVKLINPINQKEAYAKVLGEMSRIKQNEGLDIRISNAAAAALEVSELSKFTLVIYY